jgi:uncharacterized protein (TIGR02996 family)
MTDEEALLAAIIANPDDDLPRLVYADWLDENGQPDRAEFIRVQIELAHKPGDDGERIRVTERQTELLAKCAKTWSKPIRELCPGAGFTYRRGFIEQVRTEHRYYIQSLTRLLRLTPLTDVIVTCSLVDLPCDLSQGVSRPGNLRLRVALPNVPLQPNLLGLLDLLRPAPPAAEPFLGRGRWVVVAPHAHRSFTFPLMRRAPFTLMDRIREGWGNRRISCGVREYKHLDEFKTWYPVRPEGAGPHWLAMEDGNVVLHRSGGEEIPAEIEEWVASLS